MDAEGERIRGYLQAQAAKQTVPQLVERIDKDMSQVEAALGSVPFERYTERPGEEDWSANEIAAHLAKTSRSVADGIAAVLRDGSKPARVADTIEEAGRVQDAAAWWEELRRDRLALFELVKAAAGDEYLDVTWEHAMFGELNWREWLLFTRLHDLDHARQLQQTAEALGIGRSKGE